MYRPRLIGLIASLYMLLLASGCVFLEVKRQQERMLAFLRIQGTVTSEVPADVPLIVVLLRYPEAGGEPEIVDHYSRGHPGRFRFSSSTPGRFALAAFQDQNSDLDYDPTEPGIVLFEPDGISIGVGETRDDIAIVIPAAARIDVTGPVEITTMRARSAGEQVEATLGELTAYGEPIDLSDPRFGAASGKLGLWQPLDFIFEVGPGIYFSEPYDKERTPVLFVHGMTGHPSEFEFLVETLDRRRFQPWFYFYPSGVSLDGVVDHLDQTLSVLVSRNRIERIFVVAHSMGGLIARGLLVEHDEDRGDHLFPLFVSLSTPWGGHAAAQAGVDRAPAVVAAWIDMAPGSEFQRMLYYEDPGTEAVRKRLPDYTEHHLFFGFARNDSKRGPSADGVATVASQLLPEVQADAVELRGFDTSHAGVLRLPAAADALNEILVAADD